MSTSREKMAFLLLLTTVVLSLRNPIDETDKPSDPASSSAVSSLPSNFRDFRRIAVFSSQEIEEISKLEYDFYRRTCPRAEEIVSSAMARTFSHQKDTPAALLRLLFHDCFVRGCDASILLFNGDKNYLTEREAIPNQTLRGFDRIESIKEELEQACPGVVSCADILALATRDGILLTGGPFYPIFTGRRDSNKSYYNEAMSDIPKPDDNITQILNQFRHRGFTDRETVALLGGHNIGRISCQFISNRLDNFMGTGQPDPSIDPDFVNQIRSRCNASNRNKRIHVPMDETSFDMFSGQELSSVPSGTAFDSHYYQSLLKGRGLLFSDQQLMATQNTAELVSSYASDEGSTFRRDFAKAMIKMSSLGVLTGSQGQVRLNCSMPLTSG